MATKSISVVLAEDNQLVRKRIKKFLTRAADIEVVGEAQDGLEALLLVKTLQPDLLILDVEMPKLNGLEVAKRLQKHPADTRILVLSAYADQLVIRQMFAYGVSGYLVKEDASESLLMAVRGVAMGETGWISPQAKNKLGR